MVTPIQPDDPRIDDDDMSLEEFTKSVRSDYDVWVRHESLGLHIFATNSFRWEERVVTWELLSNMETGHLRHLKFLISVMFNKISEKTRSLGN